MAEYIDKQEIFDAIDLLATKFPYKVPGRPDTYHPYNEAWCDACSHALDLIRHHTSADVRPVVRGQWEPKMHTMISGELTHVKDEWYGEVYVCDQCGFEMIGTENFCPNCGADMKEEGE